MIHNWVKKLCKLFPPELLELFSFLRVRRSFKAERDLDFLEELSFLVEVEGFAVGALGAELSFGKFVGC